MTKQSEVTLPMASKKLDLYELSGHAGLWHKVSKKEGQAEKTAVRALYGNFSLGWFVPFVSQETQP